MSYLPRLFVVLALCLLAFGTWAQNSSPPGSEHMATPQSIENKAAVATTDDPNSIRDLVDELFNLPRAYPRMPSIIADTVKNRLVQAEILYRQGKKPGVREQDIVDVHNDLVDRFEGPRHSKTTLSQVRTLRMWLALSQPKLMGTGIARQDGGQTIVNIPQHVTQRGNVRQLFLPPIRETQKA